MMMMVMMITAVVGPYRMTYLGECLMLSIVSQDDDDDDDDDDNGCSWAVWNDIPRGMSDAEYRQPG